MASIPQVIRERLMGSSVVGTPGVNPAPGEIGEAVQQGATETANAGFDVALRQQNLRNEGEVNNAMAAHESTTLDAYENMKQKYAGNPDQLVPALNQFMADDLKQRQQNASNPFTKLMMEQQPSFFVKSMLMQAHEWAFKQGFDNVQKQSGQIINDLSGKASNIGKDPHMAPDDMLRNAAPLFDVLGKQAGSITGSAHQEWASEITSKGGLAVAKSMFDGAMETQPAKAYLLSQNPEFAKMIPPKDLAAMQTKAYQAIAGSVVKAKNLELKNEITSNMQMVQDVQNGKAGYSAIDAMQRKNTNPDLNNDFFNYLKDISLNVTKGTENNEMTKDTMKGQLVDEAVKLGFKLPGQFSSVADQNDWLAPKISDDLKSLYKFRDDLLSARQRGILSPAEFNTYNKQLLAPMMAQTLKTHDPSWLQQHLQGPNAVGWLKETDPSKVDDFRQPYNIIERGLKLHGADAGSSEYAQQKSAYYDAYFKALDAVKPGQLNALGRPYTQVDVAHDVLGEGLGTVKTVKGQNYVVTGYRASDGMPMMDTPKDWQAMLANAKALKDIR